MSNVKETLQKVEDLLSDRSKWTTEELARDAEGRSVQPEDPAATCFCLLGATYHVTGPDKVGDYYDISTVLRTTANRYAAEFDGETLISIINDCQGYEAVMKLIRLAKEQYSEQC